VHRVLAARSVSGTVRHGLRKRGQLPRAHTDVEQNLWVQVLQCLVGVAEGGPRTG
jgi:hypothetical protein